MKTSLMTTVLAAVLVALAPDALAAEQGAGRPDERPNVVLIMTDQQPISTIGAYGNRLAKTPQVDRLAREGVRFDGFHIAAFACSPSRACYLTGRYPHHHGVVINDVPLREDLPSMGNLFRAAGYQTAYVGKWHLGGRMYVPGKQDKWSYRWLAGPDRFRFEKTGPWRGGEDEPQCGFADKWVGGWSHYRTYLAEVGLGGLLKRHRRLGNHNVAPSGPEGTHIFSLVPAEHHMSAFLAGEAEKFIRSERSPKRPFCLVLSFYGPHLPVAPPRPWDGMFDPEKVPLPENHVDRMADKPLSRQRNTRCYRLAAWTENQFRDYVARYWGYCAYIDAQVGRVLKALDDEGLTEETIVIYTTDHGDMVAAHGCVFKLASGYDELMRVPFVLRYPRLAKPGISTAALVESVDVLPTLLDLCDIDAPEGIDGRSFRKLVTGEQAGFRSVVVTHMSNTIMVRDRDWKLIFTRSTSGPGFLELYDVRGRPLEVHNRAADPANAEVLRRMKGQLTNWLGATGHPYARVLEGEIDRARLKSPSPEELITPKVIEFRQAEGAEGRAAAELTIEWQVGSRLSETEEYWCFAHLIRENQPGILSRDTQWPEPPTTEWQVGRPQRVGPLRVPIPPGLRGRFSIRVGLYNPKTKGRPKSPGGAQRIVGTLTIKAPGGGSQQLTFEPRP